MSIFSDFIPLYDYSLIETGAQALFVSITAAKFIAPKNDDDPARESFVAPDGYTAFYTANQALSFTKCRPRVFTSLHNINVVPRGYAIDDNGYAREKAWRGAYRIGIITEPVYKTHNAMRAKVLSIIPQVLGQINVDGSLFATTGINALLIKHQVSEFTTKDVSTTIVEEDGNFQSMIPIDLAFNVRQDAWPVAMTTY